MPTGNRVNGNIGYINVILLCFRLTQFNHNEESLIPR